MKTTVFVFVGVLLLGGAGVHAQEPPPPTPPPTPPPAAPPATPPPGTSPLPSAETLTAPAVAAARSELSEADLERRRDAIFLMEATLVNSVKLAASSTQREIESQQPGLRVNMFSAAPPTAHGNHLDEYGVFFQVQIPTYVPSVVGIIEDLARNQARPRGGDPAQPTALAARPSADALLDPDALYVDAVRRYLTDAMLEYSKSLDLRPDEWLTVSARGVDTSPGQLSPSIMILRVRGRDLIEFLAGRLTRDEVRRRVVVQGFSGR